MSKKQNLVKIVNNSLDDLNVKMSRSTDFSAEELLLMKKQIKALEEIKSYIYDMNWCSKTLKNKVKVVLENDFDYQEIMLVLNTTYESVKSLSYRIISLLEDKIGTDTIDLIMSREDKVGLGITNFRVLSGSIDFHSLLLPELSENLPSNELKDLYNLSECQDELYFLYFYSKVGFEQNFNSIDKNKVAFIHYIMTSQTERYREEQRVLAQLFSGKNFVFEDIIEMIENGTIK